MNKGEWRRMRPSSHNLIVGVVFLLFAGVQATIKTALHMFGSEGNLWFDASEYWFPIARQLTNGEILYVAAFDNKTPLWHALNYLVYQTGHYAAVFYTLVAIANAAVAYLLYVWLQRNGHRKGGIIAGVLYLTAVPLMNGDIINVRSFSLAFLVFATLDERPIWRGSTVAISVLFSQVAAVAVPILLWDGIRNNRESVVWASRYLSAGAIVGALPFVGLAIIYSPDVMIAGVKASFFSAGDYFVNHPDTANPFVNPIQWASNLARVSMRLGFVLIPAIATVWATVHYSNWHWDRLTMLSVTLTAAFFATVLAKSLAYYWMPVVTFAAVLAGVGLERWLNQE